MLRPPRRRWVRVHKKLGVFSAQCSWGNKGNKAASACVRLDSNLLVSIWGLG